MNATSLGTLTDLNLTLDAAGNASRSYISDVEKFGHHYSLWKIIIIITVASCLSLVTVIGNIMVMVSFKIDKQLQTISNYFLFSLAVADFAIGLISMPLFTLYTVLGYWPLGSHICDTWLALDYLASNASVLNLLIISFDRYFSVTRPLTYRAKRTTTRAAFMIACAWGISLLLWPPWIYAWPYIEGERTVPEYACYIQFIETNHYITFGTAIAAFYVPVTIMAVLYWRIWQETEKRQKDLPNLQAGKRETSRQSNSSDEALDMDECKRPRSESSTGAADEVNSTHIAASHLDRHYPQHRKHRPLSWTWLKQWCVAWWHSGRDEEEEEDEEDEAGGPESSRTGPGYDETLTPVSLETAVPSVTSRYSDSLNFDCASHDYPQSRSPAVRTPGSAHTPASITSDSQVYTILIRLPGPTPTGRPSKETQLLDRYSSGGGGGGPALEAPSIKMYSDDVISLHPVRPPRGFDEIDVGPADRAALEAERRLLVRRPSQMAAQQHDVRMPLNAKSIGGGLGPKGQAKPASKGPQPKPKKKSQEKKADRKAAKTLSAILAAFLFTWTPYNILVLLKPLTACTGCIPQWIWDFFYYLCYINSTVNPVCYALCNATFRKTYVRILKCKWHSRHRTGVNRGY